MKQGTLAAFIKTPFVSKKRSREELPTDESEDEPQYKQHVPENKSKSTIDGGVNVKGPMDMRHLPPINDLNEMFADLINNPSLAGIQSLVDRLDGRKLRIATICSGTESPLLTKYGKPLEIEHVFSCEIEPFKQAYIERNFSPPILFRDVCELGNDEATTAYGAKVAVPGNVDILIAGTSCVDFSNLNNKKQGIDDEGESGATFKGMLSWVDRHRPTVVILENVLSAPWERSVCPKFRRVGYAAEWTKMDTKAFYIPHTRQRGYMCAVDLKSDKGKGKQVTKQISLNSKGTFDRGDSTSVPAQWKQLVRKLQRPASSPIEAFLLPEDDPRIVRTRASFQDIVSRRSAIDWARCEVRHRDARFAEEIGEKRPLTLWQEGGGCTLPDYAWNDWAVTQPERVLDLMDISLLRYAVKGIDASFKTIVWNLSQNVDRIGYPKGGLSPCMTPTMIPYISNRGGPMTGYEALAMQGLPVDQLLLTRESEDNCMDLAGNAMSTTVVGSCIMSALVLAAQQLKAIHSSDEIEEYNAPPTTKSVLSGFVGEDRLVQNKEDLADVKIVSIPDLLLRAEQSRRLCDCEGRSAQTNRKIVQCKDCDFTACSKCYGRPEHNYPRLVNGEIDLDAFKMYRLDPKEFEKELKKAVPMRLSFPSDTQDILATFAEASRQLGISGRIWEAWREGCAKAFSKELRFRTLKRQDVWSATWDSDHAYLELILDSKLPEWRLFVKPARDLEASSDIRALFGQPVARLSLDSTKADNLLSGAWELCLPSIKTFDITLSGGSPGSSSETGLQDYGDLVPSWEMSLGLLAKEFKARRVWSHLDVKIDSDAEAYLDTQINGRYSLIDKCGCANNSLHKQENGGMYLFLDPKRCTGADADYFVFSISRRRLVYGECRPVAARLHSSWRQFGKISMNGKVIQKMKSKCTVEGKWVKTNRMKLRPAAKQEATVYVPDPNDGFRVGIGYEDCKTADALIVCRLPLSDAESVWTEEWSEIDHIHERQTFSKVSWLTERLRGIEGLDKWMQLDSFQGIEHEVICERCAPSAPEVFFGEVLYKPKSKTSRHTTKIMGVEDIGEAGRFEQALKNRPASFATQMRIVNGLAEFRVGLNVASLLHQAMARLPKGPNPAAVEWRLDTNYIEKQRLVLPTFKKTLEQNSNRNEREAAQPPNFKIPLRKEQLRSLTWMLRQESSEAQPWTEQEIVEAMLSPLNWRAEAKASRQIKVLGGVLADEVGYGKTAITLGLIDSSPQRREIPTNEYGYISTKASLIIVPGHLIKQWPSEIHKFLGSKVKVISIESATHLKAHTIDDFVNADIVCVSGTLLKNRSYLAQLGALAGGVYMPDKTDKGGRYFDQKHAEATEGLKKTVEDLKAGNTRKVWTDINEGRAEDLEKRRAIFVQKKRMKGRAFRESKLAEKSEAQKDTAKSVNIDSEINAEKTKTNSAANLSSNLVQASQKRKRGRAICTSDEDDDDLAMNALIAQGSLNSGDPIRKRDEFEVVVYTRDLPDAHTQYQSKRPKAAAPSSTPGDSTPRMLSDRESDIELVVPPMSRQVDSVDLTSCNEEEELDEDGQIMNPRADMSKDLKEDRGVEINNALRADPWRLGKAEVHKNYRQMRSPVLEMFCFNRFVIDEYTYLKDKLHKMTMNMRSDRRWILSGTPPLEDFMAIKTIAVFLGVDLGISDIPPNLKAQKNWFNEFTVVEKFHSFRETKSFEWHTERHRQAERFLKQFMRQNKPEIDEIPATEMLHKVVLPAAERAIYLELLHHLQALDMNIKKSKKGGSDRDRRITESFGESQTAEEALIKRCAHFDYSTVHESEDNAIYECDRLVETRTRQLRDCELQLHTIIWELCLEESRDTNSGKHESVGLYDQDSIFRTWLMHMKSQGTLDGDATARVRRMIRACEEGIKKKATKTPDLKEYDTDAARRQRLRYNKKKSNPMNKAESMSKFLTPAQKKKLAMGQSMETLEEDDENNDEVDGASDSEADDEVVIKKKSKPLLKNKIKVIDSDDEESGDLIGAQDKLISKQPDWVDVKKGLFKDKSHMLKRVEKELVGRVKSLRFFEVVRDVQRLNSTTIPTSEKPDISFICPGPNCKHRDQQGQKLALALQDVCVFSTCGHSGCYECLKEFAADQKCPATECLSPGILNVIVKSTSLGEEEDIQNEQVAGKHWGTKIEQICDLILNKIPKDEKIILFCQFKDLTETVDDALHDKGISRIRITGSSSAKSKALGRFQDPKAKERVLVLQADDESASGANLTVANHVIFVSPLLAETSGQYQAQETQAIGRVKRFGQKRHVYVHRFLTLDTIDVEIFEKREAEKVAAELDEPEEY